MRLGLVVEGHGEVEAMPVLVRRVALELEVDDFEVAKPVRCKRSRIVPAHFDELVRSLRLAASDQVDGVLLLIDSDDDCPAQCAPTLVARAEAALGHVPVAVVLAHHEFEAWFLASIESLRGQRGIRHDAERPQAPDAIRGAKGYLERECMEPKMYYSPTVDQPALAARFDLAEARSFAPSFDKLWRDLARLLTT